MDKVADAHLHVDEMEYHHSSGGAACGESQVGRVEGQLHHGAVRTGSCALGDDAFPLWTKRTSFRTLLGREP